MSTADPSINDYAPYRRECLTPEQLRDLSRLRPQIVVKDTLLLWLQIVLAVGLAAWTRHWLAYLLAFMVIGNRYYALYIIGHDGLHRRLFPSVQANDLWNDVAILGPIGAITRLNRDNHMRHHRCMGLAQDPDVYKYERGPVGGGFGLLLELIGLRHAWRAVRNVFGNRAAPGPQAAAGPERSYRARDILILVGWQLTLFTLFTTLIGWWAYWVLWWGSVYLWTFCADLTRVWLEHGTGTPVDATPPAQRLLTYEPAWYETMLLAPMNMNHHVAHHLWPAIPYYQLPQATRAIARSPHGGDLVSRTSYFRQLTQPVTQSRAGTT